jgi:hypothetical protein
MRTPRQQIAVAVFSALALILAAAQQVTAQVIRGKLLDQYTNKPIPNATVTLVTPDNAPIGPTARTGNDGTFSIQAPAPGIYRLRAELPGYIPAATPAIELGPGDQINVNWRILAGVVQMRPVAIVASSRRTTGRLSGFYDRAQRRGFGTFITRDQIDKRRPFYVSDLLRTVPGLQVVPSPRGFGYDVVSSEGCRPAVFLDGSHFPLLGETIDEIVPPQDIEGIEVYPHAAEVPAQFQAPGGNACGAIVIWTKGSI